MRISNGTAHELKIAYIGGGSLGWAWGLMSDLALDGDLNGTVCLYDICTESAEKNRAIGNMYNNLSGTKGIWEYTVAYSLADALKGADFVIISILPGTFEEMESDVHAPEKYGIYQSVGDTTGPGGIIRSLRTVPMFVEIGLAVKEYCPDAWVINYTNPMSIAMRTLYSVFSEIKAFGCCHEVFATQELLAHVLEDVTGIKADRREIKVNVLGINHFTWFNSARFNDIDLMPIYRKFVQNNFDEGYAAGENSDWRNNSFASANRVKFDLFQRYGCIAAAGDRHLAEFCPGKWYLKDPETVRSWRFGLTTVKSRKADREKKLERRQRILDGDEKPALAETGEEGHLLIKAILGLQDMVSNVCLPNTGGISNLPHNSIVESNAVFRAGEVRPVVSGYVPDNILGIIRLHICNQEMIVKAALTRDRELAFSAFAADPLVTVSLNDARELFNSMINNTLEYLPGEWGCTDE